jgi:hypothetical protein
MKAIIIAMSITSTILYCADAKCQSSQSSGLSIIKPAVESKEVFKVYPNPAVSTVQIKTTRKLKDFYLEIFDTAGKVAMPRRIWNGEPIKVSQLIKGIYIIRLSKGRENYAEKLIIENNTISGY